MFWSRIQSEISLGSFQHLIWFPLWHQDPKYLGYPNFWLQEMTMSILNFENNMYLSTSKNGINFFNWTNISKKPDFLCFHNLTSFQDLKFQNTFYWPVCGISPIRICLIICISSFKLDIILMMDNSKVKSKNADFSESPKESPKNSFNKPTNQSSSSVHSQTTVRLQEPKRISKKKKSKNQSILKLQVGAWESEEHLRFLKGLDECGRQWAKISKEYVFTRDPVLKIHF
jgi:hypothetical protein